MDKSVFVNEMEGFSADEIDSGLDTLKQADKIMVINDEIYIAF
jgi:hypothetical protein